MANVNVSQSIPVRSDADFPALSPKPNSKKPTSVASQNNDNVDGVVRAEVPTRPPINFVIGKSPNSSIKNTIAHLRLPRPHPPTVWDAAHTWYRGSGELLNDSPDVSSVAYEPSLTYLVYELLRLTKSSIVKQYEWDSDLQLVREWGVSSVVEQLVAAR